MKFYILVNAADLMPYNCVSNGDRVRFEATGKALYELAQCLTLEFKFNFSTQGSRVVVTFDKPSDLEFTIFKKYKLELAPNFANQLVLLNAEEVETDDELDLYDDIPDRAAWEKLGVPEQQLKKTVECKKTPVSSEEQKPMIFVGVTDAIVNKDTFTIVKKPMHEVDAPEESSDEDEYASSEVQHNGPEESNESPVVIEDPQSDDDLYLHDGHLGWRKK